MPATIIDLERIGMTPVTRLTTFTDVGNRTRIANVVEVPHPLWRAGDVVYAITSGREVVRIGTAQTSLRSRVRAYPNDINKSLDGREKPTPRWEADQWLAEIARNQFVEVWAKRAETMIYDGEEVSLHLSEEMALIRRWRPRLNRSHR